MHVVMLVSVKTFVSVCVCGAQLVDQGAHNPKIMGQYPGGTHTNENVYLDCTASRFG